VGATSVSGLWPLTGRNEELRLIAEALGDGREPGGVAIIGRAGVGKTRLAREAATAASIAGVTVRWTAGTRSAQTIPLGAFAEWATGSNGSPLELVGGVIEALTTAPGGTHAVIAVDDAHQLDALSAFVLHQVVLRKAASVIVTIRGGEPVPDAVTALWKDGYLPLLELQPCRASNRKRCCVVLSPAASIPSAPGECGSRPVETSSICGIWSRRKPRRDG
jgi:hypothetical protein